MLGKRTSIIPSIYQEVEYIESTGTQYFKTDIDVQDGLTVDSVQTFTKNDTYLFGGYAENSNDNKSCFNGTWANAVQSAYPTGYYAKGIVSRNDNAIYHVVTTHSNSQITLTIDDVVVYNATTTGRVEIIGQKATCFGATSKSNGVQNIYGGRVYSLKVYKEATMLANYIPCYRKSDGEIGLYDTVTGKFYTNEGTGTFLKGVDV